MGLPVVWSYGGGTQSAAIAALIARGELHAPDLAVISDTGREVQSTWDYLQEVVQPNLSFPIHIIPHDFDGIGYNTVDLWGGKKDDTLLIPAFTSEQQNKSEGKLPKFCSNEWKERPVKRFCRERGINNAAIWIGFSIDEMDRCRTHTERWPHVYPLIEKKMSRGHCIGLVERTGWPTPPRSACWMCPYRSDREWMDLHGSGELAKAVAFEKKIKKRDPHVFLHRSLTPMGEIEFTEEDDLFAKPCPSGMCFT